MSQRLRVVGRRIRQRIASEVCRRLSRDAAGAATPTAMVVGTGRSGTTWVAEVIDAQVRCRLIFEPFNPDQVKEFRHFRHFLYMRPDQDDPELLRFCHAVTSGELRGEWVDGHLAHLSSDLRLIKDIRPTLMLRWLANRFPNVPILYVLRHPCAVVLSRMRLNWATDVDVRRFTDQPLLVEDHLRPYLAVIDGAQTPEEKHAVVWCLSNLIPLRQFASGGWTLLHYERLRQEPEVELPRMFGALGMEFDARVSWALNRPSRTTRLAGCRLLNTSEPDWTRDLTTGQVDRILAIVRAFGLEYLYGDSVMPATAPADLALAAP